MCNLDPENDSAKKLTVLGTLFRNAGIPVAQVSSQNGFLDSKGRLIHVLVCGSFGWPELTNAYADQLPSVDAKEGATLEGHPWKDWTAVHAGTFDFKDGLPGGRLDHCYAWLSVWIKSPKPLNDLLSEPNLPKLEFSYGADDGCMLWLNGELLARHDRHGPLDPEMFSQNPLLLRLGWNQLLIKVVQLDGEWKFAGKFNCPDAGFLSKLEFATQKPAGE